MHRSKVEKQRPGAGREVDDQPTTQTRTVGKRTLVQEAAARSPLQPGARADERQRAVGKRTLVEEVAARSPRRLVDRAYEQGGVSLPAELRAQLEQVSGQELGGIRINTGAEAAEAADALNARAYAFGTQINFASGEYDPESEDGQDLIAHEVAHAIQQRSATRPQVARREKNRGDVEGAGSLAFSSPAHEAEADSFAEAFGRRAGAPRLSGSATMHVARKGKGSKSKKAQASAHPDESGPQHVGRFVWRYRCRRCWQSG